MSILNFRKLLVVAVLFSVIGTLSIPQKAEAQWATFDVPHTTVTGALSGANVVNSTMLTTKEYLADMVVTLFVKATIKRIVNSTVKWINSGFQGSPGFVTNPEQFFGDIADGVAGQFIYDNPNWRFMCSSFKAKVQLAINQSYTQGNNGRFQCNISDVVNNFDNFMGDFNQGGWEGFLSITQNSQNNPIGLYTTWDKELNNKLNSKIEQQKQDLLGSNGLLSWKECEGGRFTADTVAKANADIGVDVYKVGDCPAGQESVQTPGSVIKSQLDGVLGLDNQSLVTADEINEIIGALAGQLTNRLVGGIGKGLRSLTSSGSGNRGGAFTDELLNDPEDGADALDAARKAATDKLASQTYTCFEPKTQKAGTSPNPDGRPCTPDPYYEPDPSVTGAAGTFCDLADGSVGIRIGTSDCCKATDQACIAAARAANGGGAGGGGTGGGGTGGGGGGAFRPFIASDGSTVSGPPLDADCQNASFDDIVSRAGQIFYSNQAANQAAGITIASIILNMNCGTGGTLP